MVQFGSPQWFESQIERINQIIFDKFCCIVKKYFFLFLLMLTGGCYFYFINKNWLSATIFPQNFLPRFHKALPYSFLPKVVFLLAMGPLLWSIRNWSQPVIVGVTFLIIPIGIALTPKPTYELAYLFFYLFVAISVLMASRWKYSMRLCLLISLVLVSFVSGQFLIWYYPVLFWPRTFFYIQSMLKPIGMVISEQHGTGKLFSIRDQKSIEYVLSPITIFFNMSFRLMDWVQANRRIEIRLQGLVDILIGAGAVAFCALCFRESAGVLALKGPAGLFLGGLRLSFGYFLCTWTYSRMALGAGRWLGYNLPDCSQFSILATSPLESWRRWSTYDYDWMRVLVFIPLLRKTNSSFVALFCCFSVLFLMHFPNFVSLVFLRGISSNLDGVWILKNMGYYWAQGLLVYFSFLFKNWWPPANRRSGWGGVIVTQVLLGLSHVILL